MSRFSRMAAIDFAAMRHARLRGNDHDPHARRWFLHGIRAAGCGADPGKAGRAAAVRGPLCHHPPQRDQAGDDGGFQQAVRDHNAFWAAHSVPTWVRAVQVIEWDPATRQPRYSDKAALTITSYADPEAQSRAPHDAAYEKFVGEYQQSSTVRSEERVCLPDLSRP